VKFKYIIVLLVISTSFCAHGAECGDDLRTCLDRFRSLVNGARTLDIDFTLVTSNRNGTHDTDQVHISKNRTRQFTQSRMFTIGEDESVIVYISVAEKRVFIRQQSPERDSTPQALQQLFTLIATPGSVSCTAGREGRTEFAVDLSNEGRDGLVKSIEVEADRELRILSVTTRYRSTSKVSSMAMSHISIDMSPSKRQLPDALSLLYDNKKLKPEFKDYSIIDMRGLKP
jgi:hypothetical protein